MKPREQRRAEAEERQRERERRSPEHQLLKIDGRPGASLRERLRLTENMPGRLPESDEGLTVPQLRRRGRKAGLKKKEMNSMTPNQLHNAVVSSERARV